MRRRGTPQERRALSRQFPDQHTLYDQTPATVTKRGHGWKRLVCWAAGGHDWPAWAAGQSGWPARRCRTCGAKQVRMDASW